MDIDEEKFYQYRREAIRSDVLFRLVIGIVCFGIFELIIFLCMGNFLLDDFYLVLGFSSIFVLFLVVGSMIHIKLPFTRKVKRFVDYYNEKIVKYYLEDNDILVERLLVRDNLISQKEFKGYKLDFKNDFGLVGRYKGVAFDFANIFYQAGGYNFLHWYIRPKFGFFFDYFIKGQVMILHCDIGIDDDIMVMSKDCRMNLKTRGMVRVKDQEEGYLVYAKEGFGRDNLDVMVGKAKLLGEIMECNYGNYLGNLTFYSGYFVAVIKGKVYIGINMNSDMFKPLVYSRYQLDYYVNVVCREAEILRDILSIFVK